jgi:hypothetical protein
MADICTGGTATASRSYSAGTTPDKAFDNNTGTGWYNRADTTSTMPEWIKYDLGAGNTKTANMLRVYLAIVSAGHTGFKNFTLQASNDDSNWDTIYTGLNTPNNSTGWKEYSFSSTPTAYRYWKIEMTDSYYYYQNYLMEIEIIEGDPISAGRAMTTNSKFW